MTPSFSAYALPGVPLVKPGDDLLEIIVAALDRAQLTLQTDDILVISSKVISKSENQFVDLNDITPGETAQELAQQTGKDPRMVELILRESSMVSRAAPGVLITEHRLGFVSANSGIDHSNVDGSQDRVLLLPQNPDATAANLRERIYKATGQTIAIVITDTHGRPFRLGNVGVAIGVAGMQALLDQRGSHDLFGRELVATIQGYADMVASTAHLLTGEGAEGRPLVLIRGLDIPHGAGLAADLNRPRHRDLYR